MTDKGLPSNIVCPIDHTPLKLAGAELLAQVNRAIAAGRVKNRGGRLLKRRLEGGLLRTDQTLLYPIDDDIPVLLADEAIPLAEIRKKNQE